jgi:hypothetical protein
MHSCRLGSSGLFVSLLVAPALAQESPAPPSPPTASPHCHDEPPAKSDEPAPTDRKSVLLRRLADLIVPTEAPFFGKGTMQRLDRQIETLPETTPVAERMRLLDLRANERLQFGRIEEAIADWEAAVELARLAGLERDLLLLLRHESLGWMRLGERSNCVSNHNQDSCLMPLRGGAIHVQRDGSEGAIRCLDEVLAKDPKDYSSIWLLNLAHMTLGSWPDGVDPRFRIPESAFASEHEMPRMLDVAAQLGLADPSLAGGSVLDDFDGDGLLDLVTSSIDVEKPLRLFLQRRDHTFEDVAGKLKLRGQLGGLQFFHFDANNDGRLDLLVQRGGWMSNYGEFPNSLLVQEQDGTFADRTKEAGIEISAPSQAACFADIDNDGDVDLFLGYEDPGGGRYPSRMFRNKGDGSFEDITRRAGVGMAGFVKGCAFGDYDRDRLPDLYVSTMGGDNRLYHNEGDGRFVDVARKLRVNEPRDSFSSFFFDYDNDGDLDLYASCYAARDRVAAQSAWHKDRKLLCDVNRLYENDGRGVFTDVTRRVGLARVAFPMGSNFGDVDGDGYPEIYLATGAPDYSALFPNVLYRNGEGGDGGRRFEDVTTATGTGHLQKGHGVSFGDIDNDGDQDLFVQLGGAFQDDGFRDALFENPGFGSHWLNVRLKGVKSNRFGMGARIKATFEEAGATRSVFAFVGTNSSFGGNSLQEEMGLGKASRILELEVYWPTSDTTQKFVDVPLDRTVTVVEGAAALRVEPVADAW